MHYFRDCYFDQQVAFGVARAYPSRPRKRQAALRRTYDTAMDVVLPFACIGATFVVGFMVLDVFGLEHLVRVPSFESLHPQLAGVQSVMTDTLDKLAAL